AVGNTASTAMNSAVTISTSSLLANDSDVDGDEISFVSAQNAVNGTVSLSGSNVIFTPTAGFEGTGSFTYTIRDQAGLTSTATVNVVVGSATATAVVVSKALTVVAQGTAGASVAFPIITKPADGDGSESITAIQVSGVPTGASFNAGT